MSITLEGNCIFDLQRFPCLAFDVDLNEQDFNKLKCALRLRGTWMKAMLSSARQHIGKCSYRDKFTKLV